MQVIWLRAFGLTIFHPNDQLRDYNAFKGVAKIGRPTSDGKIE